mgnify:FL=1
MITKDDIATYRATYPREHLDQKAKEQNLHCGTPLGSVLALNTLCDAYEEIEKQRDELLAALEALIDMDVSYQRGRKVVEAVENAIDTIARVKGNAA